MSSSTRRILAVVAAIAAAGSVGLIFAAMSCDAAPHDVPRRDAPAPSVIVVPGPEQVTGTIDASRMDWLSRFVDGTASGTAGQ
jgi:hypothetical protein